MLLTSPTSRGVPSNDVLCLPAAYVQRSRNETVSGEHRKDAYWSGQRLADAGRYQFHVYMLARRLIVDRGLASALDVGCGVGVKLRDILAPVCDDLTGIDQPDALDEARRQGVPAALLDADLESSDLRPGRAFDLILCADVLEHLLDPRPAMDLIRRCCHDDTLVLLSTPDRPRRRGRDNMASLKPEHVREWSRREFARFAGRHGLEVLSSRLTPQDETPVRRALLPDLRYRLRLAPTSPLCCTILLCRRARP